VNDDAPARNRTVVYPIAERWVRNRRIGYRRRDGNRTDSLVKLMDIVTFFGDTGIGNLLLLVIAITPLLGFLYKKFFLSPRLKISLAPALEKDVGFAGGNPPTQRSKSQALLLTAKRGPIHKCKAKLVFPEGTWYMSWDSRRDVEPISQSRTLTRDILEGEEVRLTIWEAFKNSDGEWFYLNSEKGLSFSKKFGEGSLSLELSFLSEEGPLSKKPYRYKIEMGSWATVNMIAIS
jgi:hypothetical protein